MHIRIDYGVSQNYTNITEIAVQKCVFFDTLVIPESDVTRSLLFRDPLVYVLKHILITIDGIGKIYQHNEKIIIDVKGATWDYTKDDKNVLSDIHSKLIFEGGSLMDEYPEQLMAVRFIKPENKVLEIGSNIGRNTLVIASLLENQSNLVTMESDPNTCITLQRNRDRNNYTFHIEKSALSYRKLIQQGWNTIVSDELLPGYFPVSTITYQDLEQKYDITFDTLVADCEGALYYILLDYPELLRNINTVIMENDYTDINHKIEVDRILTTFGLKRIYFQPGGWGPCYHNFFETWSR